MSLDEMTLRALLAGNERRVAYLKKVSERQRTGGPCPQCNHPGPHDDNGETGRDRSYCCTVCGEQWDAFSEVK